MSKRTTEVETKLPTLVALQKWAPQLNPLISDLHAKRDFAASEEKRVNAYIKPIFESYVFTNAVGERITNEYCLHRCEDQAVVADYFANCEVAHRAHGFTGEAGQCPILVAEYDALLAEHAILRAMEHFLGVSIDYMHRMKALDLCMRIDKWCVAEITKPLARQVHCERTKRRQDDERRDYTLQQSASCKLVLSRKQRI